MLRAGPGFVRPVGYPRRKSVKNQIQGTGSIDHGRRKMADHESEHVRICKRIHSYDKIERKTKMDDPRNFRTSGREKKRQGRRREIQRTRQTREKEVQ